jgi:hypothetical protein
VVVGVKFGRLEGWLRFRSVGLEVVCDTHFSFQVYATEFAPNGFTTHADIKEGANINSFGVP